MALGPISTPRLPAPRSTGTPIYEYSCVIPRYRRSPLKGGNVGANYMPLFAGVSSLGLCSGKTQVKKLARPGLICYTARWHFDRRDKHMLELVKQVEESYLRTDIPALAS